MSPTDTYTPPASILIVGTGVFGLSTALSLSLLPRFANTKISLIDRSEFPPKDGASIDASRIVRADYADPLYAQLASKAQDLWRTPLWAGSPSCYHETGLLFAGSAGSDKYVLSSWENVSALAKEQDWGEESLEFLPNPSALAKAGGLGGAIGEIGYLNRKSGWVDAQKAMEILRTRVEDLKRVQFITGTVTKLVFSTSGTEVLGVEYTPLNETTTQTLQAELTILAAGSWTPSLVDLRSRAHCTAHPIGYIPITIEEAESLSKTPVQLELKQGLFVIPPPPPSSTSNASQFYYKVAQHCHGLHNPTTIQYPEPSGGKESEFTVSIPTTDPFAPLPLIYRKSFSEFLSTLTLAPSSAYAALLARPFVKQRLCHYADTPTGDFLVDYHPRYGRTLFVATGGSGHGFKFLPALGDRIVACVVGEQLELERLWRWRSDDELRTMVGVGSKDWEWGTEDGSRSGDKGAILSQALAEKDEDFEKEEAGKAFPGA